VEDTIEAEQIKNCLAGNQEVNDQKTKPDKVNDKHTKC
jgi:hypothetical protein